MIKHLGLEDDITKMLKKTATFVYEGTMPTSGKKTEYAEAPMMQKAVKAAAKDFLNMIKSEGKT